MAKFTKDILQDKVMVAVNVLKVVQGTSRIDQNDQ